MGLVEVSGSMGEWMTVLNYFNTASITHQAVSPQWGTADAENKVPSAENTEQKGSPFKAWTRSVLSHACYPYCQEYLPC